MEVNEHDIGVTLVCPGPVQTDVVANAFTEDVNKVQLLGQILLNIRAISAKINYQNTTHSMVTFSILFETSHFNALLQVTRQLNSQPFSKKSLSHLVKSC